MKNLILLLLILSFTGCITRDNTRYNADGKPWSRDKVTFFLVRGEASKVKELVTETKSGDYKRTVDIGNIKGESEVDKLTTLVEAAYAAGVKSASKVIVP